MARVVLPPSLGEELAWSRRATLADESGLRERIVSEDDSRKLQKTPRSFGYHICGLGPETCFEYRAGILGVISDAD